MIPLSLDPAHCQARLAYWRAELAAEQKSIDQNIAAMKGTGRDALGKDYWHKRHRAEQMVRAWEAVLGMGFGQ